jgi:hypothetical protein
MAALLPSPSSASWLGLIVDWWRAKTMSDWIKIGLTLAGAAFLVWSMVQQHEYRLNQLEDGFKGHLDKHDEQYKDIQKSLRDIDLMLTRMNATKGN